MSRACFAVAAAHYNDGRGIVFIGHSQGASILIALLKRGVDAKPAVRRRLVSALLRGPVRRGNRGPSEREGPDGRPIRQPHCSPQPAHALGLPQEPGTA